MFPRRHYKLLEALRAGFPAGKPRGHVLAAVSGGSDSMALLRLLAAARERDDFELTAVYVDHGLRHAASFEAALVCATAASIGARFEYAACAPHVRAVEEALRRARYAVLERIANRTHADWIATGHTRDDQIETILFRFLRGSGRAGLAGIPRERDRIVRPLLALSREELRGLLRAEGWGWVEDGSNRDLRHTRNRLRHVVIPAIERELGRGRLEHLPEVARTWALEDELLEREAARFAAFAVRERPGGAELDLIAIDAAPRALRTRILRRWLGRAGFDREPGLRLLGAIEQLIASHAGSARLSIEGTEVVREYTTLRLGLPPDSMPFRFAVQTDAMANYADPQGAWSVSIDPSPHDDARDEPRMPLQVVEFLKEALEPPLVLRSCLAGDAIRVGPRGTRKVHDIMMEARVPKQVRDAWPVLAMGRERVIWVPGLAVAADLESVSSSATGECVRFAWRRLQM